MDSTFLITAVFCIILNFVDSQLVKDGSLKGANVTEGTWAKFSCTIKKTGVIWWRIGSFDPNNRYTTEEIYQVHGLQARPDGRPIVKRRKLTEKIEIFATKDLNRTPIQCIFQFSTNNTKDFSPFVLLVVRPTTVNGTEKGEIGDIKEESSSSLLN